MRTPLNILFTAALVSTGSTAALANDPDGASNTMAPGIEFEFGAGGRVKPAYEGASSYILSPVPLFKLNRLTFSNGFQIGGKNGNGFSIGPAFNIVGERTSDDNNELTGLGDIDTAVELGLKFRYQTDEFRAYAEIRQGFGGHEGIVGEAGLDLIARPDPQIRLYAGPRVFFANEEYMQTYFGVTPAEATASSFSAYKADGGIKSYGLEAGGRFDFDENWAVQGQVTYEQFTADAASSPIVKNGSDDQVTARFGIVRKFRINF